MAVPHFLSTGFRFKERTGVSDVQTIMDDFDAEVLTADNPAKGWYAWSKISAGVYQAPVYNGKSFRVTLVRSTQQKLQLEVKDQSNVIVCTRRINCPSTNTWTARIFTGPCHMVIDVTMFSAQPEALFAGQLDLNPDSQSAHDVYVYGNGTRGAADSIDGYGDADDAYMIDDTTAAGGARIAPYIGQNSGSACGSKTLSGARVYRTRNFYAKARGAGGMYGYMHYAGKAYQQLFCSSALSKGARIQVPIDQGVLGEFIVCGGFVPTTSWGVCVRSA